MCHLYAVVGGTCPPPYTGSIWPLAIGRAARVHWTAGSQCMKKIPTKFDVKIGVGSRNGIKVVRGILGSEKVRELFPSAAGQ